MVDIGFQGLVNVGADTAWMKLIGPSNERKKVSDVCMELTAATGG
jgi:hypothetical protein